MSSSNRFAAQLFVVVLTALVFAVVCIFDAVFYILSRLYNRFRGPKLKASELREVIDWFKLYGDEDDPCGLRIDFYKNLLDKGLFTKINGLRMGDRIRVDTYPGMCFKLADKRERRSKERRRLVVALYMTRKPAREPGDAGANEN